MRGAGARAEAQPADIPSSRPGPAPAPTPARAVCSQISPEAAARVISGAAAVPGPSAAAAAGRTVTERGESQGPQEVAGTSPRKWRAIWSEGQPTESLPSHTDDQALKLPLSFPGRGDYIIRINHHPYRCGKYHRPKREGDMLDLMISLACPLFRRIYSASQPEFALPSLCRWLTSEQNPGPLSATPWAFLRDAWLGE